MGTIRKTTIQDVANYANVSIGTIDRVIHNRGKVSPTKIKKIEEAIELLDFSPNLLARTLALGKQFVICSLFPEALGDQSYWCLPKKGVEQAANDYRDFGIVVDSFEYSLFDESSFTQHAEAILKKAPDGVVLAPLFEKESLLFVNALEKKGIPYVFIDANIPDKKNLSYIGPDSNGSGYLAGKFLNSILNHDGDVLIVNMVKGIENNAHVRVVENGFREFFESTNQEEQRRIDSITIRSTDKEEVTQELAAYYIKNPDTKGVFVTNSKAHLVSEYNRKHNLDIKVIGFDLVEGNITEIKNGGIDFIISQSPVFQGSHAIRALFDFFVYKRTPLNIQHVSLNIIVKENIAYYMDSRQLP